MEDKSTVSNIFLLPLDPLHGCLYRVANSGTFDGTTKNQPVPIKRGDCCALRNIADDQRAQQFGNPDRQVLPDSDRGLVFRV